MARRKSRRNRGRSFHGKQSQLTPKDSAAASSRKSHIAITLLKWCGSTGLLLAGLTVCLTYLSRDVELEFSKPLSPGYELSLRNTGPADQIIEKFRVLPPPGQQVIYKITRDVMATLHPDGTVSIPDGSTMYIPAAEFRELDGKDLSAGSTIKFRIPPLTDRTWSQPEATLVNIEYSMISKNPILNTVEVILRLVGLSSGNKKASFLVLNNYWTPVQPGSIQSAITQACREDTTIAKLSVCKP